MHLVFLGSLLLVLSVTTQAQSNYIAILGGGGEPKGESTIFDGDLKQLTRFAKDSPNWKKTISFNGGHTKTEQILMEETGTKPEELKGFTKKSFEEIISSYEKKIISGEMKSGDQLLIHINTHGATRSPENEKSHNVSTAEGTLQNYDTLGGHTVSLDRLKKLTDLAAQKGIKLAIIDLSCHSGNTQNLANKNTCVISGTGPNHYGYNGSSQTFAAQFNSKLKKGKSLEDVYLDARSDFTDLSFPMISTPHGMDVQKLLYDEVTPYLYSYDPKHDKLTPWLEKTVAGEQYCHIDENHQKFVNQVESLLKISTMAEVSKAIEGFKKATNDYESYLRQLQKDMEKAGFPILNNKSKFCADIPKEYIKRLGKSQECMTYSNKELLTINFDNIVASFSESLKETKLPYEKAQYKAILLFLEKAKIAKSDLLKAHPNLANIEKFWQDYPERQNKTLLFGYAVSRSLQKVYSILYKKSAALGPNPCRDFVL